jgi:putative PIN family toxin of toxin-antitoxin system
MPEKKIRAILDTNLWISFILTRDFSRLDALFQQNRVQIIVSMELLEEIIEVVQRPKFRKYFQEDDLHLFLRLIENRAEIIPIKSKVNACRDPKDDFLLSLALDGNATHLISGDKDLLSLKKFRNTRILSIKDFFEEI